MKVTVKKCENGAVVKMEDGEEMRLPSGLLGILNGMIMKAQESGAYEGTLEMLEGRWFLSERRELIEKHKS